MRSDQTPGKGPCEETGDSSPRNDPPRSLPLAQSRQTEELDGEEQTHALSQGLQYTV